VVFITAGSLLAGLYTDRADACASSLGVAAQTAATTTANCVLSFVLVKAGEGGIILGALFGITAALITARRRPSKEWFWDGETWHQS
jgi:hypothetical protein